MAYIQFNKTQLTELDFCTNREFLEANEVGAYSSSTICSCNTRKYHGLLVCRQEEIDDKSYVFLNSVNEVIKTKGGDFELGSNHFPETIHPQGQQLLESFVLETGPVWIYSNELFKLKKELILVKKKNQALVKYTLLEGESISLKLIPFTSFRRFHDVTGKSEGWNVTSFNKGLKVSFQENMNDLFLCFDEPSKVDVNPDWYFDFQYPLEAKRGYPFQEDIITPGSLEVAVEKKESVVFSASLDETDAQGLSKLFKEEQSKALKVNDMDSALLKAADQFISQTKKGTEVTAGFHWFGRWGRDTFLALPGLTLSTNKPKQCVAALDVMLRDLHNGLLTNVGVGGQKKYNSADASLWLFWTLQKLRDADSTFDIWKKYEEKLKSILVNYRDGTLYNIHMQQNGLLYGAQDDVALTWMDAVINNVPVTQRGGNAIDLNVLWYNAIVFCLELAEEKGDAGFIKEWGSIPKQIKKSFQEQFWSDDKGYLADTIDSDGNPDWSFRPNQVFAISLPNSMVSKKQGKQVLEKVKERLLTPYGLRTLDAQDPKYKSKYLGDQSTRDKTYHQGIVWPWLLGHYVEANFRVFGKKSAIFASEIYKGFEQHLMVHGLGTVSEIFDAEEPYTPVGTISQAWSVSELIRIKEMIAKSKSK